MSVDTQVNNRVAICVGEFFVAVLHAVEVIVSF